MCANPPNRAIPSEHGQGSVLDRAAGSVQVETGQVGVYSTGQSEGAPYHYETKEGMLDEVERGWQRPRVSERDKDAGIGDEESGMREKLESIIVPRVSFGGVPLSRVIDTLSALSVDFDSAGEGVNIVLLNPAGGDPTVNITLRNLSLARMLDFIVESVGYEYDTQFDAIVVRPGMGTGTRLETEFYPISRSTIIRLTGFGKETEQPTFANDPFAPAVDLPMASYQAPGREEEALKSFLQRAGVPFDAVPNSTLALADGQLIVTNTRRNLEKVRNLLRRYSEIKQVEIESKFLEVQQGDLDELGLNWTLVRGNDRVETSNRTLSDAFRGDTKETDILLNANKIASNAAPALPNTLDLGEEAGNLAEISGVIGDVKVNAVLRALSRKEGSDLMSAPKVTVLSGKTAEIVVAQELRYPESFGNIESEVGSGASEAGAAGVTITAGTPQDFTVRNIGVEMEVTPTVEDDNSISLLLEPRVTEFEGFVEYGGPSVAISGNLNVTVPAGFFQPIFSVRRVRTEVTIWDGATVVMGGLTREQVQTVNDKVPLLGDIPLFGRLFRSRSESSQKRNLLIFVTANLVSPGGSPAKQKIPGVQPSALFQNPAIVTPGGRVDREVGGEEN